MPLVDVGSISSLPAGSVTEVVVAGRPYAICNLDGELRAVDGVCIHRGGPLGHGQLHDGYIVCPFHLWEFDCRTGEYDYDPTRRLRTFDVKVEEGRILLQVP
jgi:nitrite reductase/ring-hydroxylating ferredoxin subunit